MPHSSIICLASILARVFVEKSIILRNNGLSSYLFANSNLSNNCNNFPLNESLAVCRLYSISTTLACFSVKSVKSSILNFFIAIARFDAISFIYFCMSTTLFLIDFCCSIDNFLCSIKPRVCLSCVPLISIRLYNWIVLLLYMLIKTSIKSPLFAYFCMSSNALSFCLSKSLKIRLLIGLTSGNASNGTSVCLHFFASSNR